MPDVADDKTTQKKRPASPAVPRKFEAPDIDLTPYGAQVQKEDFIQGVVESPKVRELLDAFGLQDRTEVSFPFTHMKRMHGEIWSIRLEPSADHILSGQHVRGHQWIYKRDFPEKVGSAQ